MRRKLSIPAIAVALALAAPAALRAQPQMTNQGSQATQSIELQVGETRLIVVSEKIIRISVADPAVADVQVVTQRQVLLTAKGVGATHVILWGESDKPLAIAVVASRNLDQLRAQVQKL